MRTFAGQSSVTIQHESLLWVYIFVEGALNSRTYEKEIETPGGPVKVEWPISEVIVSSICVVKKGTVVEPAGKVDPQPKAAA
jgi:hypothetical protein